MKNISVAFIFALGFHVFLFHWDFTQEKRTTLPNYRRAIAMSLARVPPVPSEVVERPVTSLPEKSPVKRKRIRKTPKRSSVSNRSLPDPEPIIQHQEQAHEETALEQPETVESSTRNAALADLAEIKKATPQKKTVVQKVRKATPLYKHISAPEYPRSARKRGQHGTVLVRVLINTKGLVDAAKLVKTSGYASLDEAALKAVQAWKFEPARRGDTTFKDWVQIPIQFRLK